MAWQSKDTHGIYALRRGCQRSKLQTIHVRMLYAVYIYSSPGVETRTPT